MGCKVSNRSWKIRINRILVFLLIAALGTQLSPVISHAVDLSDNTPPTLVSMSIVGPSTVALGIPGSITFRYVFKDNKNRVGIRNHGFSGSAGGYISVTCDGASLTSVSDETGITTTMTTVCPWFQLPYYAGGSRLPAGTYTGGTVFFADLAGNESSQILTEPPSFVVLEAPAGTTQPPPVITDFSYVGGYVNLQFTQSNANGPFPVYSELVQISEDGTNWIGNGYVMQPNSPISLYLPDYSRLYVRMASLNYYGQSAWAQSGPSRLPALMPAFAPLVPLNGSFTVQISNYDSNFTWTASSSVGTATINSTGLVTVSGLTGGQNAVLTVNSQRSGYMNGMMGLNGYSLTGVALVPTLATPVKIPLGFTSQITNFDNQFTWSVVTDIGQVSIGGTGLVTVTGVPAGSTATVTVTSNRTGYVSGSRSISSTGGNGSGLAAQFSEVIQTADGFTTQISNFDNSFTWSYSSTAGRASLSATGFITVAGLRPGAEATVTIKAMRTGFSDGVGSTTGKAKTAIGSPPILGPIASAVNGFSFQITNFDPSFIWSAISTFGIVGVNTTSGRVTLNGLQPGQSASVSVTASKTGYTSSSSVTSGMALPGPALIPKLSAPVFTESGFVFSITNFDRNVTWAAEASEGTVTISDTGSVTVAGLLPGKSADVTVTTTRLGYLSGSKATTGYAILPKPAEPTPTPSPTPSPEFTTAAEVVDPPVTISKVVKKVTIKCVKGKVTKKITAVKPVCPKGYKKK